MPGLVPENATSVELTPRDFAGLAEKACALPLDQLGAAFPCVPPAGLPYVCMDATTIHTLLTEGFGFGEDQPMQARVLNGGRCALLCGSVGGWGEGGGRGPSLCGGMGCGCPSADGQPPCRGARGPRGVA